MSSALQLYSCIYMNSSIMTTINSDVGFVHLTFMQCADTEMLTSHCSSYGTIALTPWLRHASVSQPNVRNASSESAVPNYKS